MKTLRDQMFKCRANGNLIECDISKHELYFFPSGIFLLKKVKKFHKMDKILICIKHKCNCNSAACKEERGGSK